MAPAFEKMLAIDITQFVISILNSEQAIGLVINDLKNDPFWHGKGVK